jgi:predicted AlkP superfamily phosphohydrolase/phosphomutase
MTERVAVIGLDAVEWRLVQRMIADGDLPNVARLHATGATVRLESGMPYRAEAPWLDLLTGRGAESRRYWSPVHFDPADYSCYLRGTAPVEPFYAFGSERTVVSLDVPKAMPSDGVVGAQVVGWGAHDPGHPPASRPSGLLAQLRAEIGDHPGVAIEYDGAWQHPRFLTTLAGEARIGMQRRVAALQRMWRDHADWHLTMVAMGEAHTAGHHMWHGVDDRSLYAAAPSGPAARVALADIYRGLDRAVGDIVAALPDDTVVVVTAPMGMSPADSEIATMMLIPELLQRRYVGDALLPSPHAAAWRRRGCPPVPLSEHDWHAAYMRRRFGRSERATRWLDSRERTRAQLRDALDRRAPSLMAARRDHMAARAAPRRERSDPSTPTEYPYRDHSMDRWLVTSWYRASWPRMAAFVVPSFADAHVRVNLAGRERDGVVDVEDYARVCDEVERELGRCRDVRTGRPIVADVTRLRCDDDAAATDGPTADLVVRVVEGVDAIEHPDVGIIGPFPPARTGAHTSSGFAFVAGPGVPHADLGCRPLVDLTATVCALVGRPAPAGSDGSVIPGLGVRP